MNGMDGMGIYDTPEMIKMIFFGLIFVIVYSMHVPEYDGEF